MALVEGGFAGHRGVHRHVQQLRQGAKLGRGAGGHYPGTGPDERRLGIHQLLRGLPHGAAGRRVQGWRWGYKRGRAIRDGRHAHVRRHLHQHWPRPPGTQRVERPPHDVASLIGPGDHLRPLEHRRPGSGGHRVGAHEEHVQRIAAGQRQNGHVVRIRLRQPAHGVLRPRLGLHRHDAEALAIREPRVAVCRHHRAALVPKRDRPNPLLRHRLDQRIGGIAGHPLSALLLENLGDVLDAVHQWLPLRLRQRRDHGSESSGQGAGRLSATPAVPPRSRPGWFPTVKTRR